MTTLFSNGTAARSLRGLGSMLVAVIALPAQAQLYAREAPADSSYLRAYNNSANAGVTVRLADKQLVPLQAYAASAYAYLPPGRYAVTIGTHTKTVALESNHFYTAVDASSGIQMMELSGVLNRLKSMIAIFNLLPGAPVALKTQDGKASVFDNVDSGATAQREINPLKLQLALLRNGQTLGAVPPVALERGKVFSLFVGGTEGAPAIVWNED